MKKKEKTKSQNVTKCNELTDKKHRIQLNDELLLRALESSGGFISQAAKMLECSASGIYAYMEKHEAIREKVREIRERYLDLAESKLLELVNNGNLGAICFFLKCQGKQRGYVERQELEHSGQITHILDVDRMTDDELTQIARPPVEALAIKNN